MNILKKFSIALALVVLGSGSSSASTVTSETLLDNFIGGGATEDALHGGLGTNHADNRYNSKSLEYTIDDLGNLVVTIDTTFAGYAGKYHYGDLFIMDGENYTTLSSSESESDFSASWDRVNRKRVSASANQWEYAFNLDNRSSNNGGTANLLALPTNGDDYVNNLMLSHKYDGDGGGPGRKKQAIFAKGGEFQSSGNWGVDLGGSGHQDNKVIFTMNISGIDALMSADSLAFRWAMTCANDIIEGVAKVGARTSVPEPSTIFLMLAAIAGLAMRRKKAL